MKASELEHSLSLQFKANKLEYNNSAGKPSDRSNPIQKYSCGATIVLVVVEDALPHFR